MYSCRKKYVSSMMFFSPKVFDSREVKIPPYTYAVHHYQNFWFSHKAKVYYITRMFCENI